MQQARAIALVKGLIENAACRAAGGIYEAYCSPAGCDFINWLEPRARALGCGNLSPRGLLSLMAQGYCYGYECSLSLSRKGSFAWCQLVFDRFHIVALLNSN